MSTTSPAILSWITSSQTRTFSSDRPRDSLRRLSGLRNEPLTFCLAYRADRQKGKNGRVPDMPISLQVTCEGMPLSVYKICEVPYPAAECEDAADGTVGACPDLLRPRAAAPEILPLPHDRHMPYRECGENCLLNASCAVTQSVCITANEDGETLAAGDYAVLLRLISLMSGEVLAEHTLTLHIIDAVLPGTDMMYTNWVHYDCLADDTGLSLWSDAYFAVLERYLRNAVRHGMNTLLTPAFTPALDTPIGTERQNVQLVGVRRTAVGGYDFDFTQLRRFVTLARACGIRYFEHCHLFSQWGAKNAINIYGEADGKTCRLFGWDTPADDPAYVAFLQAYLPACLAFAEEMGVRDSLLFHISDEPRESQREDYARALAIVEPLLGGCVIGDALSHYELYRQGLVRLPIVDIENADDFDGRCDRMMLYYTGGEATPGLSNRLLTSAPQKTRILGLQLFRYRACGFLHWGYNYTYGRLSGGHFDPAVEPGFYKNIPGVTYLVYPTRDGVMPSLREKHMCEALCDHRALCLLAAHIGHDAVLSLCWEQLGQPIDRLTLPPTGEDMLAWRERINREIERVAVSHGSVL